MDRVTRVLVTIIAESVLEERLLRDLGELGCAGWTISHARGKGSRGERANAWEGDNVRIETIASEDLAKRVLRHVADKYFAQFAVVAFATPVWVLRAEKYG